ncbi:MAG: alpha-amylase [Lachnospiraceae bacterium]|nr:alpha-amylase [Lachnospiraceae bacterium]
MTNGTLMQYFEWYLPAEGSLWKQLSEKAESLAANGITALWLPPAYKDANGAGGVGYAIYDLYDLGEFNQKGSVATKYGTREEYLSAIKACQKAGIEIYADIVLNHKTGADEMETLSAYECTGFDRDRVSGQKSTINAWTRFTFPGRAGKYSDFVWNAKHFDGVDWDNTARKNSIYLLEGKSWEENVDEENGNYDYLMGADVDFGNHEVLDELARWGKWYLDTTGVNGFRLDAVKHIKSEFYKSWVPAMRNYTGKELFTVGEYWHHDLGALKDYLAETDYCLSLFDVPLHYNFHRASCDADGYDLRRLFDNTLVSCHPMHAVTFVDNHDTQPGQALQSFVAEWFKPLAYAMILLRESGYPCVFYGDYYGNEAHGMKPVGKPLHNMLSLRRTHAYGVQHDYFDDFHCVGFTREGNADSPETGLACLISSKHNTCKRMYVGAQHAGQKFFDATWNVRRIITIDAEGHGDFPVNAKSVSVWIPI